MTCSTLPRVAEKGGFAAAARHLSLPKSKLSRRIAELESRLGVRLLHRTTRKLSLTEVGERYLRHCLAMRDAAQAAAEAVEQVQTEPRGTVRVACPVTLAQTTVGPIMAMFLCRHPQVRVDMRVSNRVVDLVEEGFDVALRVRATLEDSGSLVVKNLGESRTHPGRQPRTAAQARAAQGGSAGPGGAGLRRHVQHRWQGHMDGCKALRARPSRWCTRRVMWPTTC